MDDRPDAKPSQQATEQGSAANGISHPQPLSVTRNAIDEDSILSPGGPVEDPEVENIAPLIMGLRRTGRLSDALVAARDLVTAEVLQAMR